MAQRQYSYVVALISSILNIVFLILNAYSVPGEKDYEGKMSIAIVIPARLASTRFPNKPLADIGGKPMIVHVMERAKKAGLGDVYVACCEEEVKEVVEAHGGLAVMTDAELPSGTDRIFQAIEKLGRSYEVVVNVQGDLPSIEPSIIQQAADLLSDEQVDIGTLAAKIEKDEEITNPNVVKIAMAIDEKSERGNALYFSRATIPHGEGDYYHHIGLYAYRWSALKRFISLPESPLEKRERLEQLRALENGMRIDVQIVNTVPLGVDTPEDLENVKKVML